MSIVVNTNLSSILTQNSLTSATNSLNKSMERMSTGLKINNASDDPAGLFISSSMNTQIRGSEQASSNVQIASNLLQKAEGDISVIEENVGRIYDLAVQAAGGTLSTEAIASIKSEVGARIEEINRVAKASEFNGKNLLNGTNSTIVVQVGPNTSAAENSISIGGGIFATCSAGALSATMTTTNVGTATLISAAESALTSLSTRRTKIGAYENRLDSALSSLTVQIENLSSAKSTVMDADIAKESANYIKAQILQQSSASLLVQANQA